MEIILYYCIMEIYYLIYILIVIIFSTLSIAASPLCVCVLVSSQDIVNVFPPSRDLTTVYWSSLSGGRETALTTRGQKRPTP